MTGSARSVSAALDPADIDMARAANPAHDQMIADGYRLCRSSRVWMRRDRSYTLRLVYRHRTTGGRFIDVISYVIKGSFA